MQKIPSLFVRDFSNNPKLVTREYTPGTEWVVNGEGIPFRKWDGTACMIKDGWFYKRYDAKNGKVPPAGFEPAQEPDSITGHWPGWLKCDRENPADKWLWDAFDNTSIMRPYWLIDGTYEAMGPKINGNNDGFPDHVLWMHRHVTIGPVPVTYEELKVWLGSREMEGVVWHHNSGDGRMCKIKRSDFGLDWPVI